MPTHTHRFDQPLRAGAIKALRKAETVCFRYQYNRDFCGERVGIIECNVKGKLHGKEVETHINIEVNTVICDHDRMSDYDNFKKFEDELRAFESIHYADRDEQWQTIAANFKAGDIITLRWDRNNNSETLENKEMACDALKLVINRNGKELIFLVEKYCYPRHSTARMIRYEGWAETQFASRCWLKEPAYT